MKKLFPVDYTIFYLYIWQNYSCIWNTSWLVSTPEILFSICISGRTIAVFTQSIRLKELVSYELKRVKLKTFVSQVSINDELLTLNSPGDTAEPCHQKLDTSRA